MDQQQTIASYEARAKAAGKTITELCAEAQIACSTFSRWKLSPRNPDPIGMTFSSMQKVEAALRRFEAAAGEATSPSAAPSEAA